MLTVFRTRIQVVLLLLGLGVNTILVPVIAPVKATWYEQSGVDFDFTSIPVMTWKSAGNLWNWEVTDEYMQVQTEGAGSNDHAGFVFQIKPTTSFITIHFNVWWSIDDHMDISIYLHIYMRNSLQTIWNFR